MTWFDILLVTLLAAVTALGARRGLAGLAWSLGSLVLVFVLHLLRLPALPALVLALLLGGALSVVVRRLVPYPLERPWHLLVGALGGLLLGGVLISALALSFPLAVQVTPAGQKMLYPSPDLAPGLQAAVANSAIQEELKGVWHGPQWVRTLLLPDRR